MVSRIGACGRQLGSRAGLYGTAAAADDIEAVRAALGLERLDLWGSSYGTYLMTVYAARHPAHVQSLVLHGAYPIDFDPWALDRLAAARRSIGLVCARTGDCRGDVVLRDLAELADAPARPPGRRSPPRPLARPRDRPPRRGSPRRHRLRRGERRRLRPAPGRDRQRARRRPRAAPPPGRAHAAADRRELRTGIRPAVPRVPARLRLRRLAGRSPRRLSARSRRDRLARTRAVLRRGVDRHATGGRRLVPGVAERSRGRPPLPGRNAVAGRSRPRPRGRPRHEHPGAVRTPGRSPVPERALRRDPERRRTRPRPAPAESPSRFAS